MIRAGDGLLARPVEVKRKALESYRAVAGDDAIAEIRELGYRLRGLRVLHLSSTATGGGVAELLASIVPLERDAGLAAEWHLIAGDAAFFGTTKRIHNGLQGMPVTLSRHDRRAYLEHNEAAARSLADDWDVVVVHDPQPAAVRSFLPESTARWLWRCHVDSAQPNPSVWAFLRPFVERHDRAAFTMPDFVPPDLRIPASMLVPAIDPLTAKNRLLPKYLARETVAEFGIDVARPLMLQVSRFDPWKNPLGSSRRGGWRARPFPSCRSRSSARWLLTTRRAGRSTSRCRLSPAARTTASCSRTSSVWPITR